MTGTDRLAESRACAYLTKDERYPPKRVVNAAQTQHYTTVVERGAGVPSVAAHYALRRAEEIFVSHGQPKEGLTLSQVQLMAIIAGAHDDGAKGIA